ncbi:MAG: trypsin-like serine protease with C-terminal domain [Acidobacteria bacterium]|nr:trypsin-like serine protease with C-terminal domain [Acidobacteriota bacterium]
MKFKSVLYLSVSLFLIAGVALAQQPATPAVPAEPPAGEPFGSFSLFADGGGFLGVYTEEITKDNMAQYGLREARGVGITEVVKDSPAERAGLKKGDVITRFDNEGITSARKLNRLVSEVAPDHKVSLTISRGGADENLSVTIAKRQGYGDTFGKMTIPHGSFPRIEDMPEGTTIFSLGNGRRIGVSTTQLTKQLADFFGVTDGKGVLVTSVSDNSPAAKAGIKAGDVITGIDGEKVESSGDLSRAINKQKDGEVTLTIMRDKSPRSIRVTPEKSENELLRPGRTANQRVRDQMRDEIRQAIRDGARDGRIVIPRIALPSIPAINVSVPQIDLPVIPEINVVVPQVRVLRSGRRVPI